MARETAGAPAAVHVPRGASRGAVARQVGKFAAAGAVALVIVGLATLIASRRVGEREAIVDARTQTAIKAQSLVEPALTDAALAGDPAALAALDEIVRRQVLGDDLVRVKLWDRNGEIVYSDEPRLIGSSYDLDSDERSAFDSGAIEAEVSDLAKPENQYERASGKLLEVYLPLRTPSGQAVLFEAYYKYALVEKNGSRLWRSFAPITLGALLLLLLVQIPIAWSLARRLRQRLLEREQLLQRSLAASDAERRQIASDLHDGAVQDLAGVAFGLSAASRRVQPIEPEHAAELEGAATSVRNSIRELRSLIVDIYPPDFSETSFASALADLLTRASDRGIVSELDVNVPDPLPDSAARLLYRAAQEGARNALMHAEPSSLRISVQQRGDMVVLVVQDDGRGIDPAELEARGAAGHIGLRTLRGLVTDAGGRVELAGAEGQGTTLRVEVPL